MQTRVFEIVGNIYTFVYSATLLQFEMMYVQYILHTTHEGKAYFHSLYFDRALKTSILKRFTSTLVQRALNYTRHSRTFV